MVLKRAVLVVVVLMTLVQVQIALIAKLITALVTFPLLVGLA